MVVLVFLPYWAQGIRGKPHQSLLHCCTLLRNRCADNPHLGHISPPLSPVIRNNAMQSVKGDT